MGCGASSAVQIAPINDNDVITSNAIQSIDSNGNNKVNTINGYPPGKGGKFGLFAGSTKVQTIYNNNNREKSPTESSIGVSIAIQTNESDLICFRHVFAQTDIQFASEDELDLTIANSDTEFVDSCGGGVLLVANNDSDNNYYTSASRNNSAGGGRDSSSGGGGHHHRTAAAVLDYSSADVMPMTTGADEVNKSVSLQTDESVLSSSGRKSANSSKSRTGRNQQQTVVNINVTIDVGIQVQIPKHTSATQTRFSYASSKTKNKLVPKFCTTSTTRRHPQAVLRNAISTVDIESHYRLWTSPPQTSAGGLAAAADTVSDNINSINIIPFNTNKTTLIGVTDGTNILQDIESQTEPLFSSILAANSAGNDLTVLQSYDITSPFAHIEKELLQTTRNHRNRIPDHRLDAFTRLLDDMDDDNVQHKLQLVPKCDASVQTDNDILTDESPEFVARPPPCLKREMIPTIHMFREIDRRVADAPEFETIQELVDYICKSTKNDLYKVRAIFRWISLNIRFDWKYMGITMTSNEILKCREGVCKDYCQLFADMCRLTGIRVKKIDGFAKGQDYRPGHQFKPGEDITHTWNAVFILSAWRLIDTTWGTGYTEPTGKFQRKLNEHFFLTDPEVLIWTHYPYNTVENNYSRWQLLDKQLTLDEFNALPKVSPNFFDYNLKIRSKPQNPVIFRISTEVKIGSHEAMRYKYKLYPSDEMENSSLNHYVFCQLKEDRLVGSFAIQPPIEGRFFLKIFAKPEREMQDGQQDATNLHNVCTFLLECSRARKYIEPLPINELPWGPTQTFYDFRLRLHNQTGPVIVTWGGRRRLVMESTETLLMSYTIYDADGMEMDTRSIVTKDDNGNKITFTINPPRVGTFKLMIFGMPKPKQKGKWRLPLLATFMVDCKMIKPPQYDDDPTPISLIVPQNDEQQQQQMQQRTGKR